MGAPDARGDHSAVWTGTEMIVWGGNYAGEFDTGGRYDPASDSWHATSTINAPEARRYHTAVWTGNEMIIWGGANPGPDPQTGGRYDPATDSWSATSTVGAPAPAYRHSAVWTGGEMLVWGDGAAGRYDPARDSWSTLPSSGAPDQREWLGAIWTGQQMIVWGGTIAVNTPVNTGGRFDPSQDTWTATSLVDVPAPRYRHTAVWTGEAMIVWGGRANEADPGLHSGAIYFAAADPDHDGASNSCDCAPDDSSAFAVPPEIANVRWVADTLTWDSAASSSGLGASYDVVRGDISAFPVGGEDEICLVSDTADTSIEDSEVPPTETGFYYLVRGENACGSGGYGTDSSANARVTAACP